MGQSMISYVADVFDKSGGIGLVTALVFFICLGIGLERLLFWVRLWGMSRLLDLKGQRRTERHVARLEELIRGGDFAAAGEQAAHSGHPALRLMGPALKELRTPAAWRSTRDRVLAETVGPNMALGRRFLITAIQGFGLLGMLGTCKGLYAQMSGFAAAATDAGALQGAMGGMGEAFTTTLIGLSAAALTTLIYFPNEVAIDGFQRSLRRFDSHIQAALAECDNNSRAEGKAA